MNNLHSILNSIKVQSLLVLTILAIPMASHAQSWSTSGNTVTGAEYIGTLNAKSLRLVTKDKTRIKISSVGKVAIGGHSPQQKLDVAGAIRLSTTTTNAAGTMRWTGTDFEGYDGSIWSSFTSIQELDPKVGSNSTNFLSKWDGSALVSSNIFSNGTFVGIGTSNPVTGYQFAVDGKIICEEVKVQTSAAWPDYVFEKDYQLMELTELSRYINTNKHLPGIPNADEIGNNGVSMGEMTRLMMEKIEELTLHLIDQNQKIEELQKKNSELQEQIEKI